MSSDESSTWRDEFNFPIKCCMRPNLVVVSPSESVAGLMFKMINDDIGAVIVVEKEIPVGIITEKDVLERVILRNKNVDETKAKDIMSEPVISIEANRSIKEGLELIRKHKIRRLVITENGALIGLVTERRLLACIFYPPGLL